MDTSLNKLVEFHLNNTINICPVPACWYVGPTYVTYVPPQPQDGTVSVVVLFTIVSSCVADCNF